MHRAEGHWVLTTMESTAADPLLLYLLENARSAAVREEFLRLPSETYTATRDVKIFVSFWQINWR